MSAAGGEEPDLVGRCYTKARSAPLLVGVVRGGDGRSLRLLGGPYTITQLGAMVGVVALLGLSRRVWGGHGWVDAAVMVGAPFAVAFALRHVHVDGRNPVAGLASVAAMLAGPRSGRLHGRALRAPRPVRGLPLVVLAPQAAGGHAPAAAAARVPGPVVPVASGVQALLAARPTAGVAR
ncbi:hypothetical protein [Kitasatospora sp. NBC_01302]|uniref:hypothetical protein n=1 Tax=Kitasatospora sp. NBC_01302 TaxID=2903575 RepID=UPI002E164034|nr:hypothetical protein OG294_39760 [Kitasatospora sp. NBC_01302]